MSSRCAFPETDAPAASAMLQSICRVTLHNLIHLHKGGMVFKKRARRGLFVVNLILYSPLTLQKGKVLERPLSDI